MSLVLVVNNNSQETIISTGRTFVNFQQEAPPSGNQGAHKKPNPQPESQVG